MTAKPASSSLLTSTPRISAPICGPSRRTSIMLWPSGLGARPLEPLQIARGGAAREAPLHQTQRIVVSLERQVALHHGLLVDLPLGVAAADAMHLGLDRLEVTERAGMVARRERDRPLHQWQHHAGRDRVALRAHRPQAVHP